jgi:hypothetical protein
MDIKGLRSIIRETISLNMPRFKERQAARQASREENFGNYRILVYPEGTDWCLSVSLRGDPTNRSVYSTRLEDSSQEDALEAARAWAELDATTRDFMPEFK